MKFITVAQGLFGWYLCLADDYGPIGRIENFDYATYESAERYGRELALAERVSFR